LLLLLLLLLTAIRCVRLLFFDVKNDDDDDRGRVSCGVYQAAVVFEVTRPLGPVIYHQALL